MVGLASAEVTTRNTLLSEGGFDIWPLNFKNRNQLKFNKTAALNLSARTVLWRLLLEITGKNSAAKT